MFSWIPYILKRDAETTQRGFLCTKGWNKPAKADRTTATAEFRRAPETTYKFALDCPHGTERERDVSLVTTTGWSDVGYYSSEGLLVASTVVRLTLTLAPTDLCSIART
ncbi:hypothetical protein GCM10020219_024540 [Nonomuraea dietziae]